MMGLVLDVRNVKRLKGMGKMEKKGFTLIEMVLVIAIIVIISLVIYFNIVEYLSAAKRATEKLDEHISVIESVSEEVQLNQ